MNVTDLTRELVSIPSVNPNSLTGGRTSPGEGAIADKVEGLLKDLGAVQMDRWEPYPGRPSVTGFFDFGADKTLIFDVHLDTVPVDGMTVDPYGGHLDGGKIYGRGACDVKGPMATMLCALDNVRRTFTAGAKARYNLLFAAVCDEEAGFGGVSSFVKRLNPKIYPHVEGVLVAEPTLLNVVVAHKGTARWIISTTGVAAHSSTPHLGQNAIYKMAPVIERLEVYAGQLQQRPAHNRLGTPTLSIGIIHGGSAVNIVPDSCQIHVDRRLIPGETLDSAREDLVTALSDIEAVVSEPMVAAPAMETAEDSPLVQEALQAGQAAGATAQIEYANYCTDASFYAPFGAPIIVMGPGSIAQAHTKDEWIEIEQLELGVRAYEGLILGAVGE